MDKRKDEERKNRQAHLLSLVFASQMMKYVYFRMRHGADYERDTIA